MENLNMTDERIANSFSMGIRDSYYDRPKIPKYYIKVNGKSQLIPESEMTPDQIKAYYAGYDENENFGSKKEW